MSGDPLAAGGSAAAAPPPQITSPDDSARPRPSRGDLLELEVHALAHGGAGVARTASGYVVFVAGGIPGDKVLARVGKAKRAWAEARVEELLEGAPDRIAARAPEHPGVPWQVLPYERQLEIKAEQVEDALRRIGGLTDYELDPIVPALEQWRYRNKLEYSFGTDAEGGLVCGFHAPGRWEEVVPITDDVLASEAVNRVREEVVAAVRAQGLSVYDRRTNEGFLRNLVVREGRRTGQLQARLVTSLGTLDAAALFNAVSATSLLWTRMSGVSEVTRGGETEVLRGITRLEEELCELRLLISPDAFFQTNTEMAEVLYGIVAEFAALRGSDRVYDLFCGIGTIGLTLAARAGELWGLEIVEDAVADAIENARRNELDNTHFFAGDVRLAMTELRQEAGTPDVLVIDPPRAGLSQKVMRRIIEANARRIVYVSCNPTTLAPNAAQLVEAGYVLRRVRPVDMFPQTPHIECVALLDRA